MSRAKKLVLVLATSSLVTETSKENNIVLERVTCIYYPVQFKKNANETQVQVLIDSSDEVNVMTPVYTLKLGFKVYYTDIGAQIIDGSIFKTYRMVLANFQVEDKLGKTWCF